MLAQANLDVQISRLKWQIAAENRRLALRRYLLQVKYDPNQPRVPAGNPDGGQWTGGGGGIADRRALYALVERGAKPRHGTTPEDVNRDIPLHYGSDSNREIVEGVIADWLKSGGGEPRWSDYWFELPKGNS